MFSPLSPDIFRHFDSFSMPPAFAAFAADATFDVCISAAAFRYCRHHYAIAISFQLRPLLMPHYLRHWLAAIVFAAAIFHYFSFHCRRAASHITISCHYAAFIFEFMLLLSFDYFADYFDYFHILISPLMITLSLPFRLRRFLRYAADSRRFSPHFHAAADARCRRYAIIFAAFTQLSPGFAGISSRYAGCAAFRRRLLLLSPFSPITRYFLSLSPLLILPLAFFRHFAGFHILRAIFDYLFSIPPLSWYYCQLPFFDTLFITPTLIRHYASAAADYYTPLHYYATPFADISFSPQLLPLIFAIDIDIFAIFHCRWPCHYYSLLIADGCHAFAASADAFRRQQLLPFWFADAAAFDAAPLMLIDILIFSRFDIRCLAIFRISHCWCCRHFRHADTPHFAELSPLPILPPLYAAAIFDTISLRSFTLPLRHWCRFLRHIAIAISPIAFFAAFADWFIDAIIMLIFHYADFRRHYWYWCHYCWAAFADISPPLIRCFHCAIIIIFDYYFAAISPFIIFASCWGRHYYFFHYYAADMMITPFYFRHWYFHTLPLSLISAAILPFRHYID